MGSGNIDYRIWGAIVGALLAGFGGGTISRVDPFTGSQAETLEQRLQNYSDRNRIICQEQINELTITVRLLEQHIRENEKKWND